MAMALLTALFVAAGIGVGLALTGDENPIPMGGVHPGVIDLADVPAETAVFYRYAASHREIFEDIPCFCGCMEFVDHRHLYDCFVRPDGQWEAHASGCGVCLGEAATIRRLLEEGRDPAAIRDAVIAEFGTSPITAPPR